MGYILNVSRHSLLDPEGNELSLSNRALETLQVLIEHRGETLSKAFLMEAVWPDVCVEENNLNQAITSIRKVLGDSKSNSRFIKTVTGRGYCFIAELDKAPVQENPDISAKIDPLVLAKDATAVLPARRLGHVFAITVVVLLGILLFGYLSLSDESTERLAGFDRADSAVLTAPPMPGTIAVLPLQILSSVEDSADDIFVLGLHDELISRLSQIRSLKLVSRESSSSPAIRELSLMDIGRVLRVENLLTGTIVFSNAKARIKLQLLDPETGVINWSFDYDVATEGLNDIISAQDDIARRVSEAIVKDVEPEFRSPEVSHPTNSFEAYRYNLGSRRAYYNEDFEKSLKLSKQALALDPDFAGALYNFSRAHFHLSTLPLPGMTTQDHLNRGLESAERLISLTPDEHEGYVLRATALGNFGDWEGARQDLIRLQEMNAPLWDLQMLAPLLFTLGDYQTVVKILEENLQVEPINSFGRGYLMASQEVLGNSLRARVEYEMGEELTPDWWGDTVQFFLMLGRGELPDDMSGIEGTSFEIRELLKAIRAGDNDVVSASFRAAEFEQPRTSSVLVHYAAVAATLGKHDLAIRLMNRAAQTLPVHLHWLWQPVFREAWQHPEMKRLLRENGLMAYWERHGAPEICMTQVAEQFFICDSDALQ
jgi:DNA-binding winged helix-turn-helix (wHTH) protein/TolB-like protein